MEEPTATPMTDADRGQVNTAAAEVYDAFFVPALFGQFPEQVLDHARVCVGARVLDVGCGTGIVARAARRRVGANSEVAAVDPNDAMLAVARRSDASISWHAGAAESLPFDDRRFDHTISQFAAMFFTDRALALAEMARVTVNGGTVTIATWAGLERTPGYDALVRLIADELGDEAAAALRVPFTLGDVADVRRLLEPVGRDLRVDEVAGTARFPSIADWVHTELRGWTLTDLVDDAGEAALLVRAERELARFVRTGGAVAFPAPALIGTVTIDH
jgi:ubiquinone/menaquinone biosynthesis C-methylase UbiE